MVIEKFDIDALSFRHLNVLLTVIDLESVNKAAESLNTNQSNISYALDKLRQAFDDPLFVRYGNGVKPTPKAIIIAKECRPILQRLNSLSESTRFNPQSLEKTFVVGGTSYEINTLLPYVKQALWEQAPHCKLTIKLIGDFNFEALVHDCHILISPILSDMANIRYRQLFTDPYITFYDATVRQAPDCLKTFTQADHAIVVFGAHASTTIDDVLRTHKCTRQIKLQVGSFDFLPPMMKGTDLITTLPSKFAHSVMNEFQWVDCPIQVEPLTLYSLWHERYQHDNVHRWFRNLVTEASKRLY